MVTIVHELITLTKQSLFNVELLEAIFGDM